ncbi:pep-cterm sorting domain-containing protein [Anaeramoeba flamelloides]|uniref:Pep-cterm sorting domain-containing protein n=1 Tax=Anaeramoeba flamelloides TaxID=1746091 RepID=A0ABQ8Z684_9EUKA|nr:pep-cterm sorting domain-containing protein [Anaeramoeba flamelloides]
MTNQYEQLEKTFQPSSNLWDVIFQVQEQNKTFKGHKLLFALKSNFFRRVFYPDGWKLNSFQIITVQLPQVSEKLFSLVHNYIYTGEVDLTMELFCGAYLLSVHFEIKQLVQECINFFRSKLEISNSMFFYSHITQYQIQGNLREYIKKFIALNSIQIFSQKGVFNEVPSDIIIGILKFENLLVKEIELARRVYERAIFLSEKYYHYLRSQKMQKETENKSKDQDSKISETRTLQLFESENEKVIEKVNEKEKENENQKEKENEQKNENDEKAQEKEQEKENEKEEEKVIENRNENENRKEEEEQEKEKKNQIEEEKVIENGNEKEKENENQKEKEYEKEKENEKEAKKKNFENGNEKEQNEKNQKEKELKNNSQITNNNPNNASNHNEGKINEGLVLKDYVSEILPYLRIDLIVANSFDELISLNLFDKNQLMASLRKVIFKIQMKYQIIISEQRSQIFSVMHQNQESNVNNSPHRHLSNMSNYQNNDDDDNNNHHRHHHQNNNKGNRHHQNHHRHHRNNDDNNNRHHRHQKNDDNDDDDNNKEMNDFMVNGNNNILNQLKKYKKSKSALNRYSINDKDYSNPPIGDSTITRAPTSFISKEFAKIKKPKYPVLILSTSGNLFVNQHVVQSLTGIANTGRWSDNEFFIDIKLFWATKSQVTASLLEGFKCVLVWTTPSRHWYNSRDIGNTLRAFVKKGGHLIMCCHSALKKPAKSRKTGTCCILGKLTYTSLLPCKLGLKSKRKESYLGKIYNKKNQIINDFLITSTFNHLMPVTRIETKYSYDINSTICELVAEYDDGAPLLMIKQKKKTNGVIICANIAPFTRSFRSRPGKKRGGKYDKNFIGLRILANSMCYLANKMYL